MENATVGLIPAYVEGWKAFGGDNDEYISTTTLANTKETVVGYIHKYIASNLCNESVVSFLQSVLDNDELLNKTHVV